MTPLLTALLITPAAPGPKVERVGPCPMTPAAHCKRDTATRLWLPDLEPCEGSRVPVPILESLVRDSDQLARVQVYLQTEREERQADALLAQKKLEAANHQVDDLKRSCRASVEDCAPDSGASLAVLVGVGALVVGVVGGVLIGMAVDGGL